MRRLSNLAGGPVLICMALAATHSSSSALTAQSVFLDELTWTEVRDAIESGTTTVIIPTAGTEQNGPHMVLGKHKFIVNEAAKRIAEELGNALVAPVVTYVPEGEKWIHPSGHMRYAGSITLPNEHFMTLLEYGVRKLWRSTDSRTSCLIGDSGGNQRGMEAVAMALNSEWSGSDTRVHFVGDYYSANGFREYVEEHWRVSRRHRPPRRNPRHVTPPVREPRPHPHRRAGTCAAGSRAAGSVGIPTTGFGGTGRDRNGHAGGCGRPTDSESDRSAVTPPASGS